MKYCKGFTLKTIAIALLISFCIVVGCVCLLVWFSIVSFNEMAENPIEHPTSIVGGLISLVAFTLSVLWYIKSRKGCWSFKGVLVDTLVACLSLPIFWGLLVEVYEWLVRLV